MLTRCSSSKRPVALLGCWGGSNDLTERRRFDQSRPVAEVPLYGSLPSGLFSEPLVEHCAREADVPADPMAGQAACPHGLVDPARPDVEIPSGLIWPKQPVLLQRSLCCWCCCLHADIDPKATEPANGFLRRTLGRLTTWRARRADGDAQKPVPATAGRPLGNDAGNDNLPSQPRDRLVFVAFAGVSEVGPAGLEPATYRL